jgi:uroporphyrinogen decarboxylase
MSQTMTHRERLLAAVGHRQPDRVPIDLGGTRDTSIVVEGYERLQRHFGVSAPIALCDRMMRVVKMDEPILRALDIDVRAVFPGAPTRGVAADLGPRRYRDVWGVERVHPEGSYYYDQVSYPLSGPLTVADVRRYPWPDPDDPGYVQGLAEQVRRIRQTTDCAAILTLPAPFVHISQYLRGFEDWFCDFASNTRALEALFDAVLDVTLQVARRELEAVGREVDIVICADDLGTQQGLLVSRDDYRRLIKPRHRRYFQQIHDLSPAELLFHSCGSVAEVIPDLIDIGVDILNPVQTTAAGMDPVTLKRRYGSRLAFWGAMDTQHVLPRGTESDVRRMVEERIAQLGEGGGFVLAACHNLQPDVPLENVLAMFRHGRNHVPAFAVPPGARGSRRRVI